MKLYTSYEQAMRESLSVACEHDEYTVTALPALMVTPPIFCATVRCIHCDWYTTIQWQRDINTLNIVSRKDFEDKSNE